MENKHEINKKIEAFIDSKTAINERYSEQDLNFIKKYTGYGGKIKDGAKGRGVLDEYYTPDYIADFMFQLAVNYGFNGGAILEPSCAIGSVLRPFYEHDYTNITGFEINPYTAKICELLYPKATIINQYFETAFLQKNVNFTPPIYNQILKGKPTWLNEYPFDIVIGNPPYGQYANKYSTYFNPKMYKQIEMFFLIKGIEILKKDGLLIYLTAQNYMRTFESYKQQKLVMNNTAIFLDAFRFPKIFESSDIPTDILIFKKK